MNGVGPIVCAKVVENEDLGLGLVSGLVLAIDIPRGGTLATKMRYVLIFERYGSQSVSVFMIYFSPALLLCPQSNTSFLQRMQFPSFMHA